MKIDIKGSFRKLSLVQKFSVAAVFLILIIMVIVNTLTITYQRRTLRSEMGKSHLLLVRNLSKDVMEYLIFTDPLRLDELVKTIAQVPECSYAAVTDQRGRFVAHRVHKLLGQSLPGEMEGLF